MLYLGIEAPRNYREPSAHGIVIECALCRLRFSLIPKQISRLNFPFIVNEAYCDFASFLKNVLQQPFSGLNVQMKSYCNCFALVALRLRWFQISNVVSKCDNRLHLPVSRTKWRIPLNTLVFDS